MKHDYLTRVVRKESELDMDTAVGMAFDSMQNDGWEFVSGPVITHEGGYLFLFRREPEHEGGYEAGLIVASIPLGVYGEG